MDIQSKLEKHNQLHILQWWDELTSEEREELSQQIESIDFERIQSLFELGESKTVLPPLETLTVPDADEPGEAEKTLGEDALKKGEVAVLMVAGGQGSRLQFPHAKGMFPIGPVSNHTLFQLHAEKILALGQRYGITPYFLIMTSDATDSEIRQFFDDHNYFGLEQQKVLFFSQASLPAVDLQGRVLMDSRSKIFTSPNGHGGVLQALHDHDVLPQMREAGVKHVFYYQVDNPMVYVADPFFVGQHIAKNADISLKVVRKQYPLEPIGNFVLKNGRCDMIEYTELPEEWANMQNEKGQLKFWAGSIAIHVFSMDFLERMTNEFDSLPYHIAKKAVPYVNAQGEKVKPSDKNALKFERFIFDVLPKAERYALVETKHEDEFEPLKNKDGKNSPATVQAAMIAQAHRWLKANGVEVAETVPVEIGPLYALTEEELATKVEGSLKIEDELFFHAD